MRVAPLPRGEAVTGARCRHAAARGFSLVELLVTIVLAGIIFAAMIPVFVNAMKRTSGDNFRVTAVNIAQDRIEKIRQLPYPDINLANLTSTTFPTAANPQFGTSYTPVASNKQYTISYTVDTQSNYKSVSVSVVWAGSGPNYTTTLKTVVMDPTAVLAYSYNNPAIAGPFSLTVAFKNYTQVLQSAGAGGVSVAQVLMCPTSSATPKPQPTKTVIISPTMWPTATTHTVTWTGLPGVQPSASPYFNASIIYRVTCKSTMFTSTAPDFHLYSDGWMKFDTNPGGS
jgi:prepilin-type N-terminal cleavage/methylation domain-containing protein